MYDVNPMRAFACAMALLAFDAVGTARADTPATPAQARAIAKETYLYANTMGDNYRIFYGSFVNEADPEFQAPLNQLLNLARVYTPEDRVVQTPNSDMPYSWLGLDLSTEPFVLTVPKIEEGHYFNIQMIDLYTHNFAYIGARTTGNDGGHFLIAGPDWSGATRKGEHGRARRDLCHVRRVPTGQEHQDPIAGRPGPPMRFCPGQPVRHRPAHDRVLQLQAREEFDEAGLLVLSAEDRF